MSAAFENVTMIAAGAGTGKTYKLTEILVNKLKDGAGTFSVPGILAMTFTKRAAEELRERIRGMFLEQGYNIEATEIDASLIGTVNSVCERLLKRFALEAGLSPRLETLEEQDQSVAMAHALDAVLTDNDITTLNAIAERFGYLSGQNENHKSWKKDIENIVHAARSNHVAPKQLHKSAEESVKIFLGLCGKENDSVLASLPEALRAVIAQIERSGDTGKGTQEYKKMLEEWLNYANQSFESVQWSQWLALIADKPGKNSKADAQVADLQSIAQKHPRTSLFQSDIRTFITLLFDIAAKVMDEYKQYKHEHGLLDFIDQEVLLYTLLGQPEVQEQLRSELSIIMVDEFQDTSPIQLAIFVRLSELGVPCVWVGDWKQSIYGFRGADPKLMQEALESVPKGQREELSNSRRSRKDILTTVNSIFSNDKAFGKNYEPIEPHRSEEEESNNSETPMSKAVQNWHIRAADYAKRNAYFSAGLIENVREMIAQKTVVIDRTTKRPRPIQAGDIGILCRSNNSCKAVAEAFSQAGFHVAFARDGLRRTPEGVFLTACLHKIAHKKDALATMEMLLLSTPEQQYAGTDTRSLIEQLLDERLQYIAALESDSKEESEGEEDMGKDMDENTSAEAPIADTKNKEGNPVQWRHDTPLVQKVLELYEKYKEASPSEIVSLTLTALDVPRIIAAYPDTERREANCESFVALAEQYENSCNRLMTAATLGGFLVWLASLDQEGQQVEGTGADAITVMTYHKSKGLEWNCVLTLDLDDGEPPTRKLFGVRVERERLGRLDSSTILGNCLHVYLPWVYGASKSCPENVLDFESLPTIQSRRTVQNEEEKRLLYVGMTRARDYLVLPTLEYYSKTDKQYKPVESQWLNAVHKPALLLPDMNTTFTWNGHTVQLGRKMCEQQEPQATPQKQTSAYRYWNAYEGKQDYAPFTVNPSRLSDAAMDILKAQLAGKNVAVTQEIISTNTLSLRAAFHHWSDDTVRRFGDAIHAFFCADDAAYSSEQRLAMAGALLARRGAEFSECAEWLVQASLSLQEWITTKHPAATIHREMPIQAVWQGYYITGTVDMVLETDTGLVLIDHKSFGNNEATWRATIEKEGYHYQLELYKHALANAFGKPVVAAYLHLPTAGSVVEVDLALPVVKEGSTSFC